MRRRTGRARADGTGARRAAGLACTRSRRESTDRVPNARGAASASPVVEDARSCNAKIENQNRIQVRAKPRHLRSRSLAAGRLRTETESARARPATLATTGPSLYSYPAREEPTDAPVATSSPFVLTLKTVVQTFRCLPSTRPPRASRRWTRAAEARLVSPPRPASAREPCRRNTRATWSTLTTRRRRRA